MNIKNDNDNENCSTFPILQGCILNKFLSSAKTTY